MRIKELSLEEIGVLSKLKEKCSEEEFKLLYHLEDLYYENEPKVGDVVTLYGLEWYVCYLEEDGTTLMLKDKLPDELIENVFNNENMRDNYNDIKFQEDWVGSYIQKQLNSKFLDIVGIDKEDLVEMTVNYAEDEYTTDFVRIPSFKDCRGLPKDIVKNNTVYSLINKGVDLYNKNNVGVFCFHNYAGVAGGYGGFRVVRPMIKVRMERC